MPSLKPIKRFIKKTTGKPLTFKEKRDALNIERKGNLKFVSNNYRSDTITRQIINYDIHRKPRVKTISLHPKIRKNNSYEKLTKENLNKELTKWKKIIPKSEKEALIKKRAIEEIETQIKIVENQTLNKNLYIKNLTTTKRTDRQNKILVEKLDELYEGIHFKTVIETIHLKSQTPSIKIRQSLREIYVDYLKNTKKTYVELNKNDAVKIGLKLKESYRLNIESYNRGENIL